MPSGQSEARDRGLAGRAASAAEEGRGAGSTRFRRSPRIRRVWEPPPDCRPPCSMGAARPRAPLRASPRRHPRRRRWHATISGARVDQVEHRRRTPWRGPPISVGRPGATHSMPQEHHRASKRFDTPRCCRSTGSGSHVSAGKSDGPNRTRQRAITKRSRTRARLPQRQAGTRRRTRDGRVRLSPAPRSAPDWLARPPWDRVRPGSRAPRLRPGRRDSCRRCASTRTPAPAQARKRR